MKVLWSLLTFSAVLGPLLLLPFGRPLGLFGVGGPTGSFGDRINLEPKLTKHQIPKLELKNRCLWRLRWVELIKSYLLLFPWSTPAPALGLLRRLGCARLRRRFFGPTVAHACFCPPALKNVGIKAWSSGLWGFNRRKKCFFLNSWRFKHKKISYE